MQKLDINTTYFNKYIKKLFDDNKDFMSKFSDNYKLRELVEYIGKKNQEQFNGLGFLSIADINQFKHDLYEAYINVAEYAFIMKAIDRYLSEKDIKPQLLINELGVSYRLKKNLDINELHERLSTIQYETKEGSQDYGEILRIFIAIDKEIYKLMKIVEFSLAKIRATTIVASSESGIKVQDDFYLDLTSLINVHQYNLSSINTFIDRLLKEVKDGNV